MASSQSLRPVEQKKNVLQDIAPPARLSGKEIVYKYIVFLPLFIVSISVALTIAYINIRYKVPIYNSSIKLLIKDDRSSKGGGEDLILENLTTYKKRTNLSNEIELIKSGSMLVRVVKILNLNWQYFDEGNVKRTELYGNTSLHADWIELKDSNAVASVTLVRKLGGVYLEFGPNKYRKIENGGIVDFPFGKMRVFFNTEEILKDNKYIIIYQPAINVAGGLAGGVAIRQLSKETSILFLSIDQEVPQKGRDILNTLVNVYNNVNVEDKNRIVDNTIKFIDERLNVLTEDLGKVEGDLQGFKKRNNMYIEPAALGTQEYAKIEGLKEKMTAQDLSFEVIKDLKNYVSTPQTKYDLVPSALGIEDGVINGLIGEYNSLQFKKQEQLKKMTVENPLFKRNLHLIEQSRLNILEALENYKKNKLLGSNAAKDQYNELTAQLKTIPELQRQLLEIMRQQGIKEKLYLFLLQKREESEITRASTIGNSVPIDPAVSGGQVSPDVANIYRSAFVIGFLIPIIFIYLIDLLNDKIIVRNDIARVTAAPIIGEVAHHSSQNRVLVVSNKDRSVLAEQFRILRTNISFLLGPDLKSPVLLVTSSIAGEGKTFCSMNLAAVWGIAGKKTVILELDLRKPKIAKSLGLINEKGITHFMLGQVTAESLPIPIPNTDNLYIVPAGIIPPNPSEMIMDPRMAEFIAYLKTQFDLIIIDSAPVGLVSDSKIIALLADATIYIIRQRFTVKKQLPFINELYTQQLLPNIGILVNDVKIGGINSYYGYGYGYGYGYSYNYSYNYRYGSEKITVWTKIKSMFKI
ncbi:GumC family protein [Parasediminibacterium sp. JCM 36343]|uniref:GumC family protein n=1 Tax=Parasediminibacterium sp. JCM 36343 TaxID=3374279 RepID=UPI003977ED14